MKKNLSTKKQSKIKMDKAAAKTMPAKKKAPGDPKRPDLSDIDRQAVARGEIKLTEKQKAAAMDAVAAQWDAKAAQAAAKYSTIPKVDSAKIKAYLAANSGKKVVKDFCNGNSDLILCHAKWYCKTKTEKIEYLKWALDIFYNSPKYVLRNEIEAAKLKKDFEEYSLDPEKFKKKYTRTITPADGTRYEMTYREELDPWTEIENEIKLLQAPKKNRKKQGINWDFLITLEKYPDLPIACSKAYNELNVSPRKFYQWHEEGRKICNGYNIYDWKDVDRRNINLKRVRLRVSDDSLYVVKKDLIEFLKFTQPGFPKKPISK
ncbi:MAG: hypothetical protein L6428_12805 [Candidatus Aminicenantes bacterium]|nr:hypothetical protein [Acidobacteriota bacterium]MCG2812311.1 hypothetical protein [Candidatus Aminicenantes bacterium]